MPDLMPANVNFGKVTGRVVFVIPDTPDTDSHPNGDAATGTVTFTARPAYLLDATATPPTTLIPLPLVATLNATGDLTDAQGNPGIYLVATTDADLNPVGWTYTGKLETTGHVMSREFTFALPAGSVVDITSLLEVPSDLGTPIAQGPPGPAGAPGSPGTPGAPGVPGPAGSVATTQPVVGAILGLPGAPDTTTSTSTPWPAGWIPGDLDIRALIAPKAWITANAQAVVTVTDPAAVAHSFQLHILLGGRLAFNVSVDGVTFNVNNTAIDVPTRADGQPTWIRVTYVAATGVKTFYYSLDGSSWTAYATLTQAVTGAPFPSTRPIWIGGRELAPPLPYAGLVYFVELRDGINGTVKAQVDYRGQWSGIGAAGNVWTITGNPYWYRPPTVVVLEVGAPVPVPPLPGVLYVRKVA